MLRPIMRVLTIGVISLGLAACTQSMLLTTEGSAPQGRGCKVNAGSYHLPKRLLKVEISGSSAAYAINVDKSQIVSDASNVFCLDFLLSALSNDRVGIERSGNQLLKRIYTKAEDKSKDIAEAIVRAAGDLAAASAAGGLANLQRSAEKQLASDADKFAVLSFDPFDEQEAKAVNKALRPFGYCLYFDNRDDPFVPDWSPGLCKQPTYYKDPNPGSYRSELRSARALMKRGVLYRPELSHRLKILRKRDPSNPRERWHLAATEHITMPNRAPIFALGVTRTMFVTAQSDIVFENGVLKNVTIQKPSELNAIVDIPLYAVQVALSIPAATLRIFENRAANQKALWQTNAELIKTLREMRNDVLADQAVAQGELPLGARVLQTGRGAVASPTVGAPRLSPALTRLGACLDDDSISGTTEERRRQCIDILELGD